MEKMIKGKYNKLIILMAFFSLTGCGGGGSDSETVEVTEKISVEESFEELVNIIADEEEETETASLEISWEDLADNEDGFLIERSLNDDQDFVVVTSVDFDETSYVDNNVLVDSTYCYRIGAYNENGIAYSDISCIENI
ncbi:hypothetical protein [Psychromonas sp. KJ10-2]|uniref:hypothetical protein n=1 Tax=Psychromonas sp. KJ10-2 TaxID=3391822 RepID=UPI0039B6E8BF